MDTTEQHATSPAAPLALLEIRGATVVKGGNKRVLDNLDLMIHEGEHTAILGPNGSGKSSLIKLLTRQHYPIARMDGVPILRLFGEERWNVARLRSLLGIVSADQHHAFSGGNSGGSVTGAEAVLSGFFGSVGLSAHHTVTPEMRHQARTALGWMEALHLANKPLEEMSTGEARRVLIARALAPDPRALLLDEPTTGLDIASTQRFLETVRSVMGRGKTVLLVTHHIGEIVPEIRRVILLRDGKVFRDGPKDEVLTSSALSALFDAPIRVRKALRPGYYEAQTADD